MNVKKKKNIKSNDQKIKWKSKTKITKACPSIFVPTLQISITQVEKNRYENNKW